MSGSTMCVSHLTSSGRKSTLTPATADNIVVMLRAGNYMGVALAASGVPKQTFSDWMQRGESDADIDAPYRELRARVLQARAEGEVRNVAQIARAAATNWQAAAWMLERQFPDRWGRVSVRMRDTPTEDDATSVVHEDPFAEVDELAEARRRREVS
jgi:hypothetical protein